MPTFGAVRGLSAFAVSKGRLLPSWQYLWADGLFSVPSASRNAVCRFCRLGAIHTERGALPLCVHVHSETKIKFIGLNLGLWVLAAWGQIDSFLCNTSVFHFQQESCIVCFNVNFPFRTDLMMFSLISCGENLPCVLCCAIISLAFWWKETGKSGSLITGITGTGQGKIAPGWSMLGSGMTSTVKMLTISFVKKTWTKVSKALGLIISSCP